MSCGRPHQTPCTEVLARVYGYLDGELGDVDCEKIRQHLDECGPCLREYGLEEAVKRLVQKHCGCDPAPAALREKVLVRIREVRASIEFAELRNAVRLARSVAIAAHAAHLNADCDYNAHDLLTMRFGSAGTSVPALSCGWTITVRVGRTLFRLREVALMRMSGDVGTRMRTPVAGAGRKPPARSVNWG